MYGGALQAASARSNIAAVKMLLEHGANVNLQGEISGNALQAAAFGYPSPKSVRSSGPSTKEEELVSLLLERGADTNATGGYFGTALQAAAFAGRDNVVLKLLDAGAQVNSQTDGQVSTATAAPIGADVMPPLQLRRFIENGDLGGQATHFTALSVALMMGSQDITRMLVEEGAESKTQLGVVETMSGASHRVTRSNINNDSLITSRENEALPKDSGPWFKTKRFTPQMVQDLLQELLDDGIDINTPTGQFGNSLQAAISGGHENIAQVLLARDADVNAQGPYGNGLQAAICCGSSDELVHALLRKGAEVNARGGQYGHALQVAAAKGNASVVELLLSYGAQVNAEGGEYGNALLAAVMSGHKEVVRLLINAGADINARIMV